MFGRDLCSWCCVVGVLHSVLELDLDGSVSLEMKIHFSACDDDRRLTFPTNSLLFLSCSVTVWAGSI